MKTAVLALCLIGVAFAAPISEFIDPDCIEEDLAFEEPMANINAQFAIGLPDLVWQSNEGNNDEECEDDLVGATEAPFAAPVASSEAECEDDPIEYSEFENSRTTTSVWSFQDTEIFKNIFRAHFIGKLRISNFWPKYFPKMSKYDRIPEAELNL